MGRRLARDLRTLCSAASMLLCVAVCVVWVRSHAHRDYWRASEEGKCRIRYLVSESGQVGYYDYSWDSGIPLPGWPLKGERWAHHQDPAGGAFLPFEGKQRGAWGFAWRQTRNHTLAGRFNITGPAVTVESWIPYWALAMVTAVLPAQWLAGRLWQRQVGAGRGEGRCHACGYDLRATPSRCPECGATPDAAE